MCRYSWHGLRDNYDRKAQSKYMWCKYPLPLWRRWTMALQTNVTQIFFRRFLGAEDVVTAFSRSETEDRRQWPLAFPALAPSHSIQPCLHPIPYMNHTARNSTQATPMSSGEGRHQAGVQERRQQEAVSWLSPSSERLHRTKQLRCTQEPETLAWRKSVETLTNCVMNISSSHFCLSSACILYYFVFIETLGSVTCVICCWGTEASAADETITNILFG